MNKDEAAIQDFVNSYLIQTKSDLDYIHKNQMYSFYYHFMVCKKQDPLSLKEFCQTFNSVFPHTLVKPALNPYHYDGFLGFALPKDFRFQRGKEGLKAWLEKPIKAVEKGWRVDYNSLIRLYNGFARENGFPLFKEYAGPIYGSSDVISDGPIYEKEEWNFERALKDLGYFIPIPDNDDEIHIEDENGKVLAQVTF